MVAMDPYRVTFALILCNGTGLSDDSASRQKRPNVQHSGRFLQLSKGHLLSSTIGLMSRIGERSSDGNSCYLFPVSSLTLI